ncbi:periplasmic heavy metal sensor [Fluviibacterium sp. S390]|uniref:periplasmic heavy metal sensor n=1 Tax=Fluviibacterium sp. S390 TaxID=3415139 RepID=UPI003C7BB18E
MPRLRHFPWLKIVLTISLALNLLVAGLVFGAVTSREESRRALPLERERAQVALLAVLPRDHRDAVRSALKSGGEGRSEGRDQARADQADFVAALRQPEVSAEEIAALLQAQRLRRSQGAERFEVILAQEIARMSPDARDDYARRLERVRRWDRDDHHGKPSKDRVR